MKLNMKRVILGLCMVVCLFSLSACSKADTAASEVDSNLQSQLGQMAAGLLNSYVSIPEDQMDLYRAETAKNSEVLAEGIDAWKNVMKDLGALNSDLNLAMQTVVVEEIDSGYGATIHAAFEKREMDFSITTDKEGNITSVSFVPEYTFGEKMEQAFMNMVMGMGTVFIVLIFISFLIGGFKYINRFEEKIKNKNKAANAPETAAAPEVAPVLPVLETEENLADDLELAAVITAAIAASAGTSPSGLVVRSIRRAPAGKWKKA